METFSWQLFDIERLCLHSFAQITAALPAVVSSAGIRLGQGGVV